jgi:uncharacterized protein YwqG
MALSGVPFYDDDQEEEKAEESDHEFDDRTHQPLKNELSTKVAEKIAKEKREKMQLIQDLETIKDRFMDYSRVMKKQEMQSSLARAESFLSEIHSIAYWGIL